MRYVPAWPLESRSVLPVERRHQRLSWQTADCPVELVQPRSHAASASNTHNLSVTHQYNYTSVDFSYDKCKKLNSLKHPVRTTVAGSHN